MIYTGIRQTPQMIAEAALQEDVDVVGLSILSGAHLTLCPRVVELLRAQGQDHVVVLVGGIVPDEDVAALQAGRHPRRVRAGHIHPGDRGLHHARRWARPHRLDDSASIERRAPPRRGRGRARAGGVLAGDRLQPGARHQPRGERGRTGPRHSERSVCPHTGRAHIIGVTGAPGTGKSTLVTALAQSYRAAGVTVAVVAIDPSSPFTGGALLGDRVRMAALSGDDGVFIRSMATRGSLGGLSKTTGDVVTLLDAAGFERILVETVGVGQAEVEIASTAHTTLVVEAPGMGDEVQAIKAGILEIGDILVVNKADRAGAERTVQGAGDDAGDREQQHAVDAPPRAGAARRRSPIGAAPTDGEADERWQVTVMKTVAASEHGVEELRERIEAHGEWLHTSGEIALREQVRMANTLENILRAELNRRIQARMPENGLDDLVQRVYRREVDPYSAAQDLLAGL